MTEMRAAPYPADTRAKGWRFELDLERVRQSDTWALTQPEARPWLFMLWCEAWLQTPCGSLPSDGALLAARIGMPPKMWAKHRQTLMRGWWLADDGRLYHDVLAQRVSEMLVKRSLLDDLRDRHSYRRFRDLVLARDGDLCAYCGCGGRMQLDHVVPRSRGGEDTPENLVPACRSCNSRKGARTPQEWMA